MSFLLALASIISVPGALNPAVTQADIGSTICVSGWTKTIRPPASYTNALKRQQMAAENLPGPPSLYEEDHLISLEVGGNPTDPRNLWPQPWHGPNNAHEKDRLENLLHRLVCAHRVPLAEAQHELTDWESAYRARIGVAP